MKVTTNTTARWTLFFFVTSLFYISTKAFCITRLSHPVQSSLLFSSEPEATPSTAGDSRNSTPPTTQQAAYGTSKDLPNSYVRCGKCQTVFALTEEDLGPGRGRRLECSVCSHTWFQSKDRIMTIKNDYELIPLPQDDLDRISVNIQEGKSPSFLGEIKLYVGNIAFECHEDDLMEVFSKVGEVGDVSLVRDETGRNRGFGFITMRTKEDGQKAMEQLDGMPIRGRKIAVRESTN